MSRKLLSVILSALCAAMAAAEPETGTRAPFQVPKLSHPDSWSLVVVPDVQAYTERPRNHGILDLMNAWIVDNVEPLRIQLVLFTGDLVFRNDQRSPAPTTDVRYHPFRENGMVI